MPVLFSVLLVHSILGVFAYYDITIYPQYWGQSWGQDSYTHFQKDKWDGHNGLDASHYTDACKSIGTESGRWLNRDLNGGIFQHATEDPHRPGYPNPAYFKDPKFVKDICSFYLTNLHAYGNDLDMVMELKEIYWPTWIDTSKHHGKFPNNLDAASEFVVLLMESINSCASGNIPPYFEVFNEPDAEWAAINWQTVIDYHRIVGQKLKAKFPHLYVGGACQNGVVYAADRNNYKVWHLSKSFLDMSLTNLDFFSFHPYNGLNVHSDGSHSWDGSNEARVVAYIDLIENYAHLKTGHTVPLMVTEYGLASINGVDNNHPNPFIDWAYAYQHNCHMFTYQNFRDFIDRAIGFLLAHETYLGEDSLHYSFFNGNRSLRAPAKAYKFWRHFDWNHRYLRVDSSFDQNERTVSPLTLVDQRNSDVIVLLHNYKQSQANVRLNFFHNWFSPPSTALSTCFYLNSHKVATLAEGVTVHLHNNVVTVPPESSCFFKFHSSKSLTHLGEIEEATYYGHDMTINIQRSCSICIISCQLCHYAVQTTVTLPALGNIQYARLRFSVSLSSRGEPKPKTVLINGHSVSSYYQLYEPGRGHEDTRWEVFVYEVHANQIKQGSNEVKIEFLQSGGSVSTVAVILGKL